MSNTSEIFECAKLYLVARESHIIEMNCPAQICCWGCYALWQQRSLPQANSHPPLWPLLEVLFLLLSVQLRCSSLLCPTSLLAFRHSRARADRGVKRPHLSSTLWGTEQPPAQTLAVRQQPTLGPHCVRARTWAFLTATVPAVRQGGRCALALKSSWKLKELWLKRLRNLP